MANPPINFMVDLETLDTKNSAYVYEIGVVAFGAAPDYEVLGEKHIFVGRRGQDLRSVSAGTLQWTMNTEGRIEALKKSMKEGVSREEAGGQFSLFIAEQAKGRGKKTFWSKGNFDYPILESLFKDTFFNIPWQYYMIREFRSVLKWAKDDLGASFTEDKNSHDALEDARNQVALLREITQHLMGGK